MGYREALAIRLAAHPRSATQARHRVVVAVGGRLGEQAAHALGLLVSEVVTNAILHGGGGGELDLSVATSDHAIRVEVVNSGPGFVPRPRALAPDAIGGWGLYLVEQLASSWGVSCSDRTTVWFELPCSVADAA